MAGVVFNSTLPISVRDTYTEFNQIDFLVSLKSNSIQKNSFRLNGKLKVFPTGDYTGIADLNSGIF